MDFNYNGKNTNVISFPLGGIGSGSIGLSGTGRLVDWEIFNRPNKLSTNGYSHFSIKAVKEGKLLDARILHGDYPAHYMGEGEASNHSWGIGHGPNRKTLSSMPHYEHVSFNGTYPIATMNFKDDMFPGEATLTAFNPFIPMNDKDSSIPAGFYEWTISNDTDEAITYTIALSVKNPFEEDTKNIYHIDGDYSMISMQSEKFANDDINFGNMTIGTEGTNISYQENWFRGSWFDDLATYWNNFATSKPLQNRSYEDLGKGDMCTLAVTVKVDPHSQAKVPYVIGWYYPNQHNYWGYKNEEEGIKNFWHNYYAKLFTSSDDVVNYALSNWEQLYKDTKLFKDALFSTDIPKEVLDAVQGNISILKSPTALRLENGEFYGWEGVNKDTGSCEGSCTHVWNYAYALPFLFPKLERSMRDLDYRYNIGEIGDMMFRLMLPLGRKRNNFRACVDGQMGGVMKVYRDWKISGDTEWLKSLWPQVKKSLEYAWHPENVDRWDPEMSGVITGRQHHTLDMELFGPNSWLNGFYLGALKAGAQMAEALGENDTASLYMDIFNKGKKWTDDNLFNGKHYIQKVDLTDKSILKTYDNGQCLFGESTLDGYWNNETGEIKYQIGEGSSIDQLVGQWHANLMGLGDIFDRNNTETALKALYDLNFKKSMRNHANPCRAYSVNGEAGIVICEWENPDKKPSIPVPYSEETMNGFEYAAACHMIQTGLFREGEEIVKAVRDRYDGFKRNPWAEIECGNNYARSMASYALILTYSGFSYNMVLNTIGFEPIKPKDVYSTFWSVGEGWGTFSICNQSTSLDLLYGRLQLKEFKLPSSILVMDKTTVVLTNKGSLEYSYEKESHSIVFNELITLDKGDSLHIV